jgi:phosphoribosylanthranilate isomerase
MSLTRFVKVGNISNLSDARYCSGMGVDLLGFSVVPETPSYITGKQFQEIRGWITGPKIIAELHGIRESDSLDAIIENYRPDFLEITLGELHRVSSVSIPLILSVSGDHISQLKHHPQQDRVAYLLITEFTNSTKIPTGIPALIALSDTVHLADIDDRYKDCGIALSGSPEIRPGIKNYDQLADVLEMLDE